MKIEYHTFDELNKKSDKEIYVQHGQMAHPDDKHNKHSRKCNIHKWHGNLHICKHYSRELKNRLKKYAKEMRKGNFTLTVYQR